MRNRRWDGGRERGEAQRSASLRHQQGDRKENLRDRGGNQRERGKEGESEGERGKRKEAKGNGCSPTPHVEEGMSMDAATWRHLKFLETQYSFSFYKNCIYY